MTILINVLLLLVATALAFASFFGKALADRPVPWIRRVTWHGWLSIFCFGLAVMLGTIKEIRNWKQDTQANKDKTALLAQIVAARAETKIAEDRAASDAAVAQNSMRSLHEELRLTQGWLEDVRTGLGAARQESSAQSTANLISALANTDQTVKEIWIYLPLTEDARAGTSVEHAFLPSFRSQQCSDLTGIELEVATKEDDSLTLSYDPTDSASEHQFRDQPNQWADAIGPVEDEDAKAYYRAVNPRLRQKSWKDYAYFAEIKLPPKSVSAAAMFSVLSNAASSPVSIVSAWPGQNRQL